jgi:hypothetical protein
LAVHCVPIFLSTILKLTSCYYDVLVLDLAHG